MNEGGQKSGVSASDNATDEDRIKAFVKSFNEDKRPAEPQMVKKQFNFARSRGQAAILN